MQRDCARAKIACRSTAQLIARAVWLYFRFPLSLLLIEELLLERGITVSYESIGAGRRSSARPSPAASVAGCPARATSGTWTRCGW